MTRDHHAELDAAVALILDTNHPKKLIVAGPGAGKTTTFKKLLGRIPLVDKDRRLVITFLGGLKRDLEKDLGDDARVQTFHGYCFALLKQNPAVRAQAGFTDDARYVPRIGQLIRSDWALLRDSSIPKFVPSLRKGVTDDKATFFLARGCYYDCVGFDDSTAHILRALTANATLVPAYDVVIVDEFQDLNQAEVAVLETLASRSNVVVAGDDDQALYGKLRDANEQFIRDLHARNDYAKFDLPFCMRCPSVITNATNNILTEAMSRSLLGARIPRQYDPFPRPALDSQYPTIKAVQTTVASLFGKYVAKCIDAIPDTEVADSHDKGFPTVLIIGSPPYKDQVTAYLRRNGYVVQVKSAPEETLNTPFTRDDAFAVLKEDTRSNLGWRILFEVDRPADYADLVARSEDGAPLYDILDPMFRDTILAEVEQWAPPEEEDSPDAELDPTKPTIRVTSFEGAKGMSAQHVFVLGLYDTHFPYNPTNIKGLDVRRMVVALTRTRKQCYLLYPKASYANGRQRLFKRSTFIEWIDSDYVTTESVSAASLS